MPDNATDLLSKAIAAKIAARGQAPVKAEETEEKHSHSYKMACPACQAAIQFSDEDLDSWRTSDETSEVDNDDDSNEGDDGDADDDGDDSLTEEEKEEYGRASLAKRLVAAAKTNNK
jgi:hypothetical protein